MRDRVAAVVLVAGAVALALAAATVSERLAWSFEWGLYLVASFVVFGDLLDLGVRLYFRRIGGDARSRASIPTPVSTLTPVQKRLHLRPYAILAAVHDLEDEIDEFLAAYAPFRDHLWVVDDASTDGTVERLRQAGIRTFELERNVKKPAAIRALLAEIPAEIETVLVVDPDATIRDRGGHDLSDFESVLFDFQRSGADAVCPRLEIRQDGLLVSLQSLEYWLSFEIGRRSLGDRSVTSGIAVYRRAALEAALARHSLSVYAEDLENALIILSIGRRVYYDGRLVIETEGKRDWPGWFSQRVGWSYGLLRVCHLRFAELWRAGRGRPFATYHYLIYLLLLVIALHPLKLVGVVVLAASFGGGLAQVFGADLAPGGITEPIYFLAVYAKYLMLSSVALFAGVERGERLHLVPVVPVFVLYSLALLIPVTVGYLNYLSVALLGRRLYADHYQDEASLAASIRKPDRVA